jgi:hypothetical protein
MLPDYVVMSPAPQPWVYLQMKVLWHQWRQRKLLP